MLAEANRSAFLTNEQRSIMVQQMQAAEFRVAELETWLSRSQSQVGHVSNTASHDKVLLQEAVVEVDRLKRRVNELTQELADTSRREVGKYTGEQMHEQRSTPHTGQRRPPPSL